MFIKSQSFLLALKSKSVNVLKSFDLNINFSIYVCMLDTALIKNYIIHNNE